ncbi:transposase [Bacillus thuringiensis]|uniref:transposase n=1 Tax=Bacillus thuringiensis TaxID=1428 RepID=UPI0018CEB2EE|nr:transposase [Bacillus thuringiensis]
MIRNILFCTDYIIDFGQVFTEQIAHRVRGIIWKCCLTRDITIIKGSVGKNYIHLLISR